MIRDMGPILSSVLGDRITEQISMFHRKKSCEFPIPSGFIKHGSGKNLHSPKKMGHFIGKIHRTKWAILQPAMFDDPGETAWILHPICLTPRRARPPRLAPGIPRGFGGWHLVEHWDSPDNWGISIGNSPWNTHKSLNHVFLWMIMGYHGFLSDIWAQLSKNGLSQKKSCRHTLSIKKGNGMMNCSQKTHYWSTWSTDEPRFRIALIQITTPRILHQFKYLSVFHGSKQPQTGRRYRYVISNLRRLDPWPRMYQDLGLILFPILISSNNPNVLVTVISISQYIPVYLYSKQGNTCLIHVETTK